MTLRFRDTGWQVCEWQLAIGKPPTGVFSLDDERATLVAQDHCGLPATGIVDPATAEAWGLQPLELRDIADPRERLFRSVTSMVRAGTREWNARALLVTRGKRTNGAGRYAWGDDWINYHAGVCGVEWGLPTYDVAPSHGDLVMLDDGRSGIVVTTDGRRPRVSLAPILGRAEIMGVDSILSVRALDVGSPFGTGSIDEPS